MTPLADKILARMGRFFHRIYYRSDTEWRQLPQVYMVDRHLLFICHWRGLRRGRLRYYADIPCCRGGLPCMRPGPYHLIRKQSGLLEQWRKGGRFCRIHSVVYGDSMLFIQPHLSYLDACLTVAC